MALWLDLIPKLHRADGHDDGFDPLRTVNEDNHHEESRALADDLLVVIEPTSTVHDVKLVVPTSTYSARKMFLRSPAPTSLRSTISVDAKSDQRADSRPYDIVQSAIAPRTALAATLSIGCVALIVNCVIFVVVYRRRVNLKRLPTTDNHHYPLSPSVNVVGTFNKPRCVDRHVYCVH